LLKSKKSTKNILDKRNSVTFQLVHRSQKDPLVADETAPQRVLVPIKYANKCLGKYNVFFDNEYNYLKNLKDTTLKSHDVYEKEENVIKKINNDAIDNKLKLNLPSSVFESNIQEKIGLLNKAIPVVGPQLDLDPDIVAALDDELEYDTDNELEDNFVQLANFEDHVHKYNENNDGKYLINNRLYKLYFLFRT
jgi:protein LTV1